jgi:NAD(P)-dependent dehydrogenase (short-subunit alcohol dehydrogenase family)
LLHRCAPHACRRCTRHATTAVNAGGGRAFLGGSWTIPNKEWHDNFALNLFAAICLTNAVHPALRTSANPGFSRADWLRNIPLGRIGATEDIAEVVALLVSDRGKFLTGAKYGVDATNRLW